MLEKKKKTTIDSTRVFSPFRSFVRTTMIGMERNPRECNLRWNKRVKSESKDGWMVGKSGRSQEARRLKKTRNRGGRGRRGKLKKRRREREREREALVRCILTPSEIPRLLSSLVDPAPFPPDQ